MQTIAHKNKSDTEITEKIFISKQAIRNSSTLGKLKESMNLTDQENSNNSNRVKVNQQNVNGITELTENN